MAQPLLITAPAKLNLVLRVGARDADGYHPLASLMVALDGLADDVVLERADARRLECPGAPAGADNLAWRALDALEAHTGRGLPARITITKRIPQQAGLGGGSSDAAAVLVGIDRLYALGLGAQALERLGASLGSDVPFFVRGGTQWATGRGERLAPRALPGDLWAVICGPVAALATGRVYERFDALNPPGALDTRPPEGHWADASWVGNDLWPAARSLAPDLEHAARTLRGAGAVKVLLCGSGGAIAGLWYDAAAARQAAGRLASAIAIARPMAPRGADGTTT